jgi:cytochrome d ubiquinol oxidase subunit I
MEVAGPLVGVPFSLEGFAFFTEAIFLGIYLYGWDWVPPLAHWERAWWWRSAEPSRACSS